MFENAFKYITRKKTKLIIVLTLFIVILASIYSCLVIVKYNGKIEEIMNKSSNSSFLITENNEGVINLSDLKGIENISGIEKYNYIYEQIAKLKDKEVYKENNKVEITDLNPEYTNVVKIYGITNSELNNEFLSEVFNLVKGRHISKDDVNKVMIHESLAKQNGYNIGDKISLSIENNDITYEIVGIFSGRKQEKYTGLSSDFSENMIFTDYKSSQKALNTQKDIVNKLTIFVSSPKEMKTTITKIKKIQVDWSKYTISKNNNAYKEALDALNGVKDIIKIMTYSIMIGGSVILSLILILWLRERIYEIGILLSIGVSKFKIVTQFILELLLVSLPSILMSLIFGNLILRQIASGFISSDDTVSITSKFLNDGYNMNNLIIFIESYIILVLIIVISVVITSGIILMKKPKKILSQIS